MNKTNMQQMGSDLKKKKKESLQKSAEELQKSSWSIVPYPDPSALIFDLLCCLQLPQHGILGPQISKKLFCWILDEHKVWIRLLTRGN